MKKTWKQKLQTGVHKVEIADKKFADIPEGATMLVATPLIVDTYLRNIPEGTHTSLQQMRKDLAAEYGAQYMCPITAGIFLRIAAEAGWEDHESGKKLKDITPFWRMIDRKTPAFKKLNFGTDFLLEQRKGEGLPE